jgi:hypothetical protein
MIEFKFSLEDASALTVGFLAFAGFAIPCIGAPDSNALKDFETSLQKALPRCFPIDDVDTMQEKYRRILFDAGKRQSS